MSSLRLSYASSPESDLEHSPGPPVSLGATTSGSGPGSGAGSTGGRLAKASSDPSVVMPADSNTDTLPPYQPTYDSRYGFSNQNPDPHSNNISPDGSGHNSKDALFMSQNQLHLPPDGSANAIDSQGNIYKGGHYGQNMGASQEYHKSENHKRQSSNVHGHYSSKSHNLNDNSPMRNSKEGLYGTAPDLPPRVDRTAKPGSLSKAATNTSTRSAHERLFGSKAGAPAENNTEHQNSNNDAINNKHSSLERRQNSKSDSLSSYDSFNNPNSALKQRLGPNAHDDLKSSIPKIDAPEQMSPSKYQGSRWEQPPGLRHNHEHMSRHAMNSNHINEGRLVEHNPENMSPRHSREVDKTADILTLDQLSSRVPGENGRNHDVYNRYNRSPSKPQTPKHVETKTDYGKYSRNNTSQDYTRHSHQDLTQAHLSIHQSAPAYHHSPMKSSSGMYPHSNGIDAANMHHMQGINGPPNTYKPVPPPKPKNYKPPFKNQPPAYGANDAGNMPTSNNGGYQHGKSHSNPVNDQRSPNYYYNMPASNDWHTETAVRYTTNMHGHYDMAPSGNGPNPGNGNYEPSRRHTSISYSSRNEAMMQMTSQDIPPYGRMEHSGEPMLDSRPNIVDLQGSREQRGSAFELYRKPVHHNMR